MFEPRHNILSNVRTNVRKYVMTWLERLRESNRPLPGPLLAELSISLHFLAFLIGNSSGALSQMEHLIRKEKTDLMNLLFFNEFYVFIEK